MSNKISDEARGYVFFGTFLLVATLLGVCCAVDLESRGHGRASAILFGAACSVMGLWVSAFLLLRIWRLMRREKRTRKTSAVFNEYDTFVLSRLLPDKSLPLGTRGVVLMVFEGSRRSYEVEFPDGQGGSLGSSVTYTITEEYMTRDSTPSPG